MLIHHEMDTRPQYTPWLAGVFVAPVHRQHGVGRALTRHVIREAAARDFHTLYLFTPSAEAFFSHLGWSIVERTRYRDADVTLMSYQVA
jgi:N-acetylglutamate synthase-like GNAT family acetyltransferase